MFKKLNLKYRNMIINQVIKYVPHFTIEPVWQVGFFLFMDAFPLINTQHSVCVGGGGGFSCAGFKNSTDVTFFIYIFFLTKQTEAFVFPPPVEDDWPDPSRTGPIHDRFLQSAPSRLVSWCPRVLANGGACPVRRERASRC